MGQCQEALAPVVALVVEDAPGDVRDAVVQQKQGDCDTTWEAMKQQGQHLLDG